MHRSVLSILAVAALILVALPNAAVAASHFNEPVFTNPVLVELHHLFYWSFKTASIVFGHLFSGNWALIGYDLALFAGICADHSPLVGGILFGTPRLMLETTFHFFFVPVYIMVIYLAARFGVGAAAVRVA